MIRRLDVHRSDQFKKRHVNALTSHTSSTEGYSMGRIISNRVNADNSKGQGRKRIAVACSRCRRRKIKCSGDSGNGLGCEACRTAGPSNHGGCQFLRVSSQDLESVYANFGTSSLGPSAHAVASDFGFSSAPIAMSANSQMIAELRFPRHHASSVCYGNYPLFSESYCPANNGTFESLRYVSNGLPYSQVSSGVGATGNSGMFSQQYHGRDNVFEPDELRYGVSGPLTGLDSGSNNSSMSMDGLMHSLPLPVTPQRLLPDPRSNVDCAMQVESYSTERMHPLPTAILKSQGSGLLVPVSANSSESYPSPAVHTPSADSTETESPLPVPMQKLVGFAHDESPYIPPVGAFGSSKISAAHAAEHADSVFKLEHVPTSSDSTQSLNNRDLAVDPQIFDDQNRTTGDSTVKKGLPIRH